MAQPISFVSMLVQSKCFEACNPGTLKQRMVKHGRDIADNWAKLENYKAGCIAGCEFAAAAEHQLSTKDRASFEANVKSEQTSVMKILPVETIEQQGAKRVLWSDSMRSHCLDACKGKFVSEHKKQQSCSDGCDRFFQIIQQ